MQVKISELINRILLYNDSYRQGNPIVSDLEYDRDVELLRFLDPSNSFLNSVEPEKFKNKRKMIHSSYMLSMEKAYGLVALERFVKRVKKNADDLDIRNIMLRVTAKLDGLAGKDNGKVLASRGDGKSGYDISSVFTKGVIPIGGRGIGLGEIVVVKSYFEREMKNFFEHPRNMVVGIVLSDKLNKNAKKALDDGKVHFVPYAIMKNFEVNTCSLLQEYKNFYKFFLENVDYPMDGLVIEVTDKILQRYMGSTSHHHRWQIAFKVKGETADSEVVRIDWQVGRFGYVTPVIEIDPVRVSGAKIKRVTAHHAGNIHSLKIGIGSRIRIVRSGEVIPKLDSVLESAKLIDIPTTCPSCGEKLIWNNNFLVCLNYKCNARAERRLRHWFKTIANTEWFGNKTIRKIVNNGCNKLESVYKLSYSDFESFGFGQMQAKNLSKAIYDSLNNQIDDWRFLAAFSIPALGLGDSLNLLRNVSIKDIPYIKKEKILSISGFGDKTSELIASGVALIRGTIVHMLGLDFNLVYTDSEDKFPNTWHSLSGKRIVFTGKMRVGSRIQVKNRAVRLGIKIQKNISRNTDYLVCGASSSKSKIDSANSENIGIISEEQYLLLLKEGSSK